MLRTRALVFIPVLILATVLSADALALETAERSLQVEIPVSAGGSLRIENLLGSVEIRRSEDEGMARIVAHVVAEAKTGEEAASLAESIVLEQPDDPGQAIIHVVWPVDRFDSYRLPKEGMKGLFSRWTGSLFKKGVTEVEYDGQAVRVGKDRKATGLAVHVTVSVPFDLETSVHQSIGAVHAKYLRGKLRLEVVDGSVEIVSCFGVARVETDDGDVRVASFQGRELFVGTGTGEVDLEVVRVDRARLETDSGTIRGVGVTVDELSVESASGAIELADVVPRSTRVRTGSGDVDVALRLKTARSAVVHSDSGDVVLRLAGQIGFDLAAETKTGEVKTLGMDLDVVEQSGTVSRLKRGGGGVDLEVRAAAGSLTVRPYDASRMQILMGRKGD